ncbi:hypothetical protein EYF80_017454 [Liparis tanakae]|uniref:Uncharacterized protein n=1 Tax=Liparis tanakae TaxID=230148 RepID=A0A4Z2I4W9_9TELE|nr:hypothetical protein EYF80_017454 [Liparis tanakae]
MGLEPLNKGSPCHQRARRVKSHWMDNDTYRRKRGRMRDTERREKSEERKADVIDTGVLDWTGLEVEASE